MNAAWPWDSRSTGARPTIILRRLRLFAVGLAATLLLAGCATLNEPPETPTDLAVRAKVLQDDVRATGKMTEVHRLSMDRLLADVEAYNKRTGDFDVSVERAASMSPCAGESGSTVFSTRLSVSDCTGCCCNRNCPLIPPNHPGQNFVCFPDGGDVCDSFTCVAYCSYKCVRITPRVPIPF